MRPRLFCKISKLFCWYFLSSRNYLKVFAIHRTWLVFLWNLLKRINSTFFINRSCFPEIFYIFYISNLDNFTLNKVYLTQKRIIKYCFFILIYLIYEKGLVPVDSDTKGWHFKDTACYVTIAILALIQLVFWEHEVL